MSNIRYTKDHEWIRIEGDVGTVGITGYAANKLGDVVFVDLPEVGRKVEQGGEVAVVESVKAASDVYSPLSGDVTAVNATLTETPETVNADPEGEGWFCRIRIAAPDAFAGLMDKAAYDAYCAGL